MVLSPPCENPAGPTEDNELSSQLTGKSVAGPTSFTIQIHPQICLELEPTLVPTLRGTVPI